MSVSCIIKGIIDLPEDFEKMYKLVEACRKANVSYPNDLVKYYFDKLQKDAQYCIPDLKSMAEWLDSCKSKTELANLLTLVDIKYTGDALYDGAFINLSAVPATVKVIKIYLEA